MGWRNQRGRLALPAVKGTFHRTVPESGTGGENQQMRQRKSSRPTGSSMETGSSPTSARSQGRLGRDVQAKIGNQLRAIYDDVVKEGVPDRFVDLLKRLDKQDEKGSES